MSILKIWVGWFCAAFLPLYFGGESSSDSSTTANTTTTNQISSEDKRIVGGDASVGVSGSGNTVYSTDAGSVQAAMTLAGNVSTKALDASATGIAGVLDAMKALAASNKDSFDKTLALVGTNSDKTQESFAKATEEVNGNRVLVGLGVIVIGFIAAKGAYK